MMFCPHCRISFVGSDISQEAPDNLMCPACGRNMSDQPIPPVTGAQVFAKYVAAILSGLPLGGLAGAMIASFFGLPGVVPVGLALLAMFMIGDYLGNRIEKMYSVFERWCWLLAVAVVPSGVLAIVFFVMA